MYTIVTGYFILFKALEDRLAEMEKATNTAIMDPCPCAGLEGHCPSIALRHWDQCSWIPLD